MRSEKAKAGGVRSLPPGGYWALDGFGSKFFRTTELEATVRHGIAGLSRNRGAWFEISMDSLKLSESFVSSDL